MFNSKQFPLFMPTLFLLASYLPVTHAREQKSVEELLQLSLEELTNLPITSTSHFDEDSLSVGSTVSIITKQDWQQRGARRTHDALLVVPSLAIFPSFLGQYSVRIRGFAQPDARGIETLWDGVPLSSFNVGTADINRPNIQLNTLDNIEVTRGPGSAFYGTGAFHGVVSLHSFESERDITNATAGAGSNGYYSSAIQLSRPAGEGQRLHFALSGNGQNNQDIRYNYTDIISGLPATSERDYQYDSQTAVMKLQSNPNRDLSYKLGLYYDKNVQDDFHGQGLQTVAADVSDVDSDLGMGKFSIKQKITTDSSIEALAYHWLQRHEFKRPLDNGNNVSINTKENRSAASIVYRHHNIFNNTQLSLALGHRREKIVNAHRTITSPAGAIAVDVEQPFAGTHRKINSFLIQNKTVLMNDKLTLHYGLRHDRYSDVGNQTTPRLGIIYSPDNIQAFKLLYGNAFRAPTAVESSGSNFISSDPNIQPETIDTYELVYLKQSKNSKTELVLFTSYWKDSILAADTDNNGSADTYINSGDNSSRGIEISNQTHFDKWNLNLNGSYVISRNDMTGEQYAAFPKYIFNLGAGYQFNDSLSMYINNRIHLKADNRFGEGALTTKDLPDYWRTDVGLTNKQNKKLTLYANIRNLFNRNNILPSMMEMENGIADEEISLEMGLRYRFNP